MDAIERLRRRGRELRADLHRIQSAPYPSSRAKQRMREQIEALAMQGAPSVSRLVELDGPVDFQTQHLRAEFHGELRAVVSTPVPDAVALMAWAFKDQLIQRLDAEITTESDDASAMSHGQRQQAEAETQTDLLEVERHEAALTWAAQAQACRSSIVPTSAPSRSCRCGWSRHRVQTHCRAPARGMRSTLSARGDEIVQPWGACQHFPGFARALDVGDHSSATSNTNRAGGHRLLDGASRETRRGHPGQDVLSRPRQG
jgi:hypothetical protein